jgi:peptidoglycan/xylan/chitin deacetylase (PgdA/CDA1 family)
LVDWGDGEKEYINGTNLDPVPHIFAMGGLYQIKVSGVFQSIQFTTDKAKLISIDNWGNIKWKLLDAGFAGCLNMQGNYIDVPNILAVTNLAFLFYLCVKFNYPITFDTRNITIMQHMLRGCSLFNQSIENLDTRKVTTMELMLSQATSFNQDVSKLNYEAITGAGLSSFIVKGVYSTAYYDALLISLAAQNVQNAVTLYVSAYYTPGGASEAARNHLINIHSWNISDNGPSFSNGLLVLNFDDGGSSQYVAYEDLVTHGEVGTFYIISNSVGTGSNLTWEQIQTMLASGMDIQCHTYDHTNLTLLTEAQVYAEYDNLDAQFLANSIPPAHHTSYPYGANNANVVTWTAARRLTARSVNVGYVTPSSNKFGLKTYDMDVNTDYESLKAAMLVAKNYKWAIMAFGHGINGSQIPRNKFNEIIEYAQYIGMDIITVSQLYALM